MQNLNIKCVIERGKLIVSSPSEFHKLEAFSKSLADGVIVDVYYSAELDASEKTLGQLAKVHVLIKQLADDTGYTSNEMKKLVKETASLYTHEGVEKDLKSFADCSKSELSAAIQACIEIGKNVGSNVY